MKKTIFLCVSSLLMLFMSSCSNDDITVTTTPEELIDENLVLPEDDEDNREFGIYNALGYGYNVTGEYANTNSTGLQVIDIPKYKEEQASRLITENVFSQEYREEYAKDAAAFSRVISKKISVTDQQQLYGKTISKPFKLAIKSNSKFFDPKYIYGSYNLIIRQKRFRFNATTDLLSNYLTQNFSQDLQTKTPKQIVHNYGTHVTVDIYTGAKLDAILQAQTTNQDRQRAAKGGIKTVVNILNSNSSNSIDIQDASKNYSKILYYTTRGGDKSKGFANIINLDRNSPKINIANWQNSSTPSNSVLVDLERNGLVLIYDLVKDPTKKAQLKAYVDQYLINNQVILAS